MTSRRVDPDLDTAYRMAEELMTAPHMELVLRPESLLMWVGMIQLACRHPALPPSSRDLAARFLGAVREHYAHCPTILDVIARGDDPAEDR